MSTYVFGPVPSRRLGRSLGIDLTPAKTCTYDCIYCQLGRTTCKTQERRDWVPLDAICEQLAARLPSQPDYITLGGSGEPTLHAGIGPLIDQIKAMTRVPVAVLTNGSLFWQAELRRQLMKADLVIPSLDAGDRRSFQRINRPLPSIRFSQLLEGLQVFREQFRGEYWLEVMLLNGLTDQPGPLVDIARCVDRIRPDRVQLNTATRPTSERHVRAVPPERLERLASVFRPRAEVIAHFRHVHRQPSFATGQAEILDLLRRRPCTLDDIAGGLNMHRHEVLKYLEELTAAQKVGQSMARQQRFYVAAGRHQRE